MIRYIALAIFLGVFVFALSLMPTDAEGCAAQGRPGDHIRIAEESAIIIWDPVKKVEHFIRRAAFDTKSVDFAFLVPTPTMPKLPLAEVGDPIFREMASWLTPKIVEQSTFKFAPITCLIRGCGASPDVMMSGSKSKSVRVLGEQEVGGYKAAILEADNQEDLSKWLTDNGYSSDPELQSWLAPYVAAKWKITAFKIIKDPKSGKLATTKPVRMSFATDKPFFPYREPEVKEDKQKSGERLLRVLFVSNERMEGKLGGDASWQARVPWSDRLTDMQRENLISATGVADDEMPQKAWLTNFEDTASPRPSKDEVYFTPSPDQAPIRPKQIQYNEIWIPIDAAILWLSVVGFLVRLFVSKRTKLPPPWSTMRSDSVSPQ